jgi:hypothetical protein
MDTVLKKYGVPHIMMADNIKRKSVENARRYYYSQIITSPKLLEYVIPLFTEQEFINTFRDNKYKFQCKTCNQIFEDHIDGGHMPRCWDCHPYLRSKVELEIIDYIKSICPSIDILQNKRSILPSGMELDIYIPSKNIAIEYDGLFWHSEIGGNKDSQYHLNKTIECESQGIQLIHIFEDEWLNKSDIVKRRIRHLMGMNTNIKIYARKCQLKEISHPEASLFLSTYHIQGSDRAAIRVGAFYDNVLVSVMTFGKRRLALGIKTSDIGEFELLRFCIGEQPVVGIAGKLFSYFIKQYHPTKVVTYGDRRYSSKDAFYTQIGFVRKGETCPNYWYIKYNELRREYRFGFRKSELSRKLKTFDPLLTEWQNMQLNGYDRIWDCGHFKYEWKAPVVI